MPTPKSSRPALACESTTSQSQHRPGAPPRRRAVLAAALLAASLAPGSRALASTCTHPAGNVAWSPLGDLTGSGTITVADAICGVLVTLAVQSEEPMPGCLQPSLAAIGVDVNCDGASTVGDVLLLVQLALGHGLPASVDPEGVGCPAACAPCAELGAASCLIGGGCVPEGGTSAMSQCLLCEPAASVSAYTHAPDLTPCGSGQACLAGACALAVPGAPTDVGAIPGDGQATVSFSPPGADGGSPITGYEVEVQPSGELVAAAGSPAWVAPLDNGVSYTFRVRALNLVGASGWSEPSAAISPDECVGLGDGTPCAAGEGVCAGEVCAPLPSLSGAGTLQSPFAWSDGSVARTCLEYRQPPAGYDPAPATTSGIYLLEPASADSAQAWPAYCDMQTSGGGWTAVYDRAVSTVYGPGVLQGAFDWINHWQEFSWGLGRQSRGAIRNALIAQSTELRHRFVRNHNCGTAVPVQGYAGYGYAYLQFEAPGGTFSTLGFGDAWDGTAYTMNTTISTCVISSWNVCPSNQYQGYNAQVQGILSLGGPWAEVGVVVLSAQCDGVDYLYVR